jgi:hypothetical protein
MGLWFTGSDLSRKKKITEHDTRYSCGDLISADINKVGIVTTASTAWLGF